MNVERPNPFGGYRWALVQADGDWLHQLPVIDLVQGAANGTVEEADPRYGRRLFEELDRRGRDAWWEAAVLCLEFLARASVGGQTGAGAVAHLRRMATQQRRRAGRLLLELLAEHRDNGVEAAARLWQAASPAARAEVGRRLFVTACGDARSGIASLTPEQMRALAKQLVGA